MSASIWNAVPSPVFDAQGQFAAGAKAFFYTAGTTTPLTTFQDASLLTSHAFPVVASNLGLFPQVYLPFVDYRVRVTDVNGVAISDIDNISNPAPPTSGSGIVVTTPQILQTGDPIWRLRVGTMDGFVRMNGRAIGSATSGAGEYANAAAQPLFSYLWANLPDSVAAVSGGRGSSAVADFAANKTIVVPSMRGLVAYGLDDMGATEASILQAVTTCTTNNTTTVVVVTAADIVVGMEVKVGGVANGTVVSISGTSIVLSQVAAGSASGVQFRASIFTDATAVGVRALNRTVSQLVAQMAAHNHAVTDPGHTHNVNAPVGANFAASGGVFGLNSTNSVATTSATTGIMVGNTGSGQPMATLPSGRLGTWYMKL